MCGQEPVRRQEGLQPLCSQKEVQPVRDQEEKGALLERIDRPREI